MFPDEIPHFAGQLNQKSNVGVFGGMTAFEVRGEEEYVIVLCVKPVVRHDSYISKNKGMHHADRHVCMYVYQNEKADDQKRTYLVYMIGYESFFGRPRDITGLK
jgi:hypothetical protein